MSQWKIEESKVVLDASPFIVVRQERCILPNGLVIPDYNIVTEPDAVVALVITENKNIILVEQYKHGIGEICLELPGGLSEGDAPLAEIQREVLEETGYISNNWQHLASYINNPTRANNHTHAFIASNARKISEQNLDPTENIIVHTLSISDVFQAIQTGQIRAVHTIATVFQGLALLDD
ncbi:MAG: NUDIX hydrolase [Chloroflexota bacterium]